MSESKIYVITFHTESFQGKYGKYTIKKKATNVIDLITEIENNWCKENKRVVVDLIFSEECK